MKYTAGKVLGVAYGGIAEALAVALVGCGGTSGQPAVSAADSGVDATVVLDAGNQDEPDTGDFDVTIAYADPGRLPDTGAGSVPNPTTGLDAEVDATLDATLGASDAQMEAEAAPPPPVWASWPACACDDPSNGAVLDDSGACANVVYSGHSACEAEIKSACDGHSGVAYFPPCCAFRDAGTSGSNAPLPNTDKFALCAALYVCIFGPNQKFVTTDDLWYTSSRSQPDAAYYGVSAALAPYCGLNPADAGGGNWCLVQGAAHGPCKQEYENAFETTDPQTISTSLDKTGLGNVGSEGAVVTALLECAVRDQPPVEECFFPDSGDVPGPTDAGDGGDAAAGDASSP
jgi:hypothetical protein